MDHTRIDLDQESIFCPEFTIQSTSTGTSSLKMRRARTATRRYQSCSNLITMPTGSRNALLPLKSKIRVYIVSRESFDARHVRKNKKTYHSAFISSNGNIYWSVYRTGQRSRKSSSTQIACMTVFDMQEILNGGQTVLWYLPDLMEYLAPQKRASFPTTIGKGPKTTRNTLHGHSYQWIHWCTGRLGRS